MSWENPFSSSRPEEPSPADSKTMKINQIRKIDNKTGEIVFPEDYEKKPSMKEMKQNAAKLKQLEKELEEQKRTDHLAMADARHQYYRTHGKDDPSYEEWSKEQEEKGKDKADEKLEDEQDDIDKLMGQANESKISKFRSMKRQ